MGTVIFIMIINIIIGGGYHKGDVSELFKIFKTSAIINRQLKYFNFKNKFFIKIKIIIDCLFWKSSNMEI